MMADDGDTDSPAYAADSVNDYYGGYHGHTDDESDEYDDDDDDDDDIHISIYIDI